MKALDHILNQRVYGDPPCPEATDWVATLGEAATLEQVWEQCPRGDWLAWYLDAVDGWDDRLRRLFAVDCATRALRRERDAGREPDGRSWNAVAVARAFADGQATRVDLAAARAAAWAARDAARDAAWAARDAARDASWAAAWAAEVGMQADWIRQHVACPAAKETKR